MIDGYASLKEEDSERDKDKANICFICAMEKPEVVLFLFRWKRKVKPSKNIPSNTISGIIFSTATLSNSKMPVITQVLNSTSINKYRRPKLTGSLMKGPKMSQDKFNNLSMIFRENLTP